MRLFIKKKSWKKNLWLGGCGDPPLMTGCLHLSFVKEGRGERGTSDKKSDYPVIIIVRGHETNEGKNGVVKQEKGSTVDLRYIVVKKIHRQYLHSDHFFPKQKWQTLKVLTLVCPNQYWYCIKLL